MLPRIRPIITVVLILVLCRAALNQGEAKVISGGRNVPVNPPVEVGGYRTGLTPPL
jgi:hypothetical protein